ncbi:MAG TPA: hypothetical protein VL463_33490 [Kofleriaceae bacterium]|nr:hypothetical protein [Kofleriaceae bacterium]
MKKIAKKLSLAREIVRPLQHVVGGIGIPATQYLGCPTFYTCPPEGGGGSAGCGTMVSKCVDNYCTLQN